MAADQATADAGDGELPAVVEVAADLVLEQADKAEESEKAEQTVFEAALETAAYLGNVAEEQLQTFTDAADPDVPVETEEA